MVTQYDEIKPNEKPVPAASGLERESSGRPTDVRNAIPNRAFEARAGGGHMLDARVQLSAADPVTR